MPENINTTALYEAQEAILDGYRDLAAGRVFESSSNFKADMAMLDKKETRGWSRTTDALPALHLAQ